MGQVRRDVGHNRRPARSGRQGVDRAKLWRHARVHCQRADGAQGLQHGECAGAHELWREAVAVRVETHRLGHCGGARSGRRGPGPGALLRRLVRLGGRARVPVCQRRGHVPWREARRRADPVPDAAGQRRAGRGCGAVDPRGVCRQDRAAHSPEPRGRAPRAPKGRGSGAR